VLRFLARAALWLWTLLTLVVVVFLPLEMLERPDKDWSEQLPVFGVMVGLTVLGWCFCGRLRFLAPVGLLAGVWGFYYFPLESREPRIDWLFPYYFGSAVVLGYLMVLTERHDPVRRRLGRLVQLVSAFPYGIVFVPLLWPFLLVYVLLFSAR
jgi:hypothetical protein